MTLPPSYPPPDRGIRVVPAGAIPSGLAPAFALAVETVLAAMIGSGMRPKVFQGVRTDAEQAAAFEHGYSKAKDAEHSWHGYGLAVDIADAVHGWEASGLFWKMLATAVRRAGLTSGAAFLHFPDVAHVQWRHEDMPWSPQDADRALLEAQGKLAVWERYGAV